MYYSEKEARNLVLKAGVVLKEKKLIARTWGNISARISETEFIITPSGMDYDGLKPEDLVKVKIPDLSFEGSHKPSSEKALHAVCYEERKDVNFIVHTHQFYASAVCAAQKDMVFAPCAKYGISGSGKLSENVRKTLVKNPHSYAVLMAKHGAVMLGTDMEDAFAKAEALEESCRRTFEENKHKVLRGVFLDDYAQMFSLCGKPCKNEDKMWISYVKEKNAAAASFAKRKDRIPCVLHLLEHFVYSKKYSKLKDGDK